MSAHIYDPEAERRVSEACSLIRSAYPDTLRAAITDGQEEPEDSTATTFRGPGSSCPCRVQERPS